MIDDDDDDDATGVGIEPWRLMIDRMTDDVGVCPGFRDAPP